MQPNKEQLATIIEYIVEATGLGRGQVQNCVELLQGGATVPFIARYRKEMTGELDEVRIRDVEQQYVYFRELGERKLTVLNSIEEQGKLTPELRQRIEASSKKTEVEDLYLPFKPKRRTTSGLLESS